MEFTDKTIVCADCQQEFLHTAEDQKRYAERGFTNEPKRCRNCREQRKVRSGRGGQGGGGGRRESSGDRGGRPPMGDRSRSSRPLHKAVCAACGKETEVPFKPTGDRPVYCRDCYRAAKP